MDTMVAHSLWGFAGGFAAVFLAAFTHREEEFKAWPKYYRHFTFYIMHFVMMLMGGCLVAAYFSSGNLLSPILSMNVGATAPLILQNFAAKTPKIADTEQV